MQSIEQLSVLIQHCPSVSLGKFGALDVINIKHTHGSASVALFGAHILSFIPNKDKRERLFVSPLTLKDGSKPIRGGIPVCWPWFSSNTPAHVASYCENHTLKAPSHGTARTQIWQLDDVQEHEDFVEVSLSPSTLGEFGFCKDFKTHITIKVSTQLEVRLVSHNQSTAETEFGCALHSYLAVDNVEDVCIEGVTSDYQDKTQHFKTVPTTLPYIIEQEVDRVHVKEDVDATQASSIVSLSRSTVVTKLINQGNNATVIWNPWKALSSSMGDLEPNSYRTMLCIESALVEPITLGPMQSHCLSQIIV